MKKLNLQYPRLTPLWIAVFVDILGFSIILPFLPFFVNEYNSSPLIVGLLLSSNAIFGFICGPILGSLSDKFGRKNLLLISQLGTFIGFLILAFSQNITMLFIARIVDGIFGGQFPISKAVIGDVVPPKERSKQMTNIGIAFTLASLIGPGTGALLSDFGIIGPGLLASALSLLTIIFTAVYFKETLPLKTGTLADWQVKQSKKMEKGGSSSILQNKQAMYILLVYGLLVVGATMFQSTLSVFGFLRLGLNEKNIGLIYTLMGVFQIFYRSLFFNRIRKKFGDTWTALMGMGGYIIAFFLLTLVRTTWQLTLTVFFISFCGASARGILMGFASRVVDHKNQGKINGLTSSLDSFSQIISPLIGTFLLSLTNENIFGWVLSGLSAIVFTLGIQLTKFKFDKKDEKNLTEDQIKEYKEIYSDD
ncbi:MFS transporter [Candidatus Lokiarchaeum ossiferum]|uniref:MFS transporter n=1 Tax=Candidatus Lokiarchaeum ossiferum TaxID=2951803 RepID=UPI00352E2A45